MFTPARPASPTPTIEASPEDFMSRAELCKNPVGAQLFRLMHSKKSNLSVSADVFTTAKLLQLADLVGPHICVLKIHVDILEDFTPDTITQLQALAKKHNFIIFEDRKFADIGSTVEAQYKGGTFKIAQWATITNAHCVPGPGVIAGLKKVAEELKLQNSLLLLAEMSSEGNLITPEYTKKVVAMAAANLKFVIGFITQHKVSADPSLVNMAPGVELRKKSDNLGQQYNTPESVIANGADIIIVGRGIIAAPDPVDAAKEYKEAAWKAYEQRLIPSNGPRP
jgi:orotidine 5'-phosphate decarboxylase subfamily 1